MRMSRLMHSGIRSNLQLFFLKRFHLETGGPVVLDSDQFKFYLGTLRREPRRQGPPAVGPWLVDRSGHLASVLRFWRPLEPEKPIASSKQNREHAKINDQFANVERLTKNGVIEIECCEYRSGAYIRDDDRQHGSHISSSIIPVPSTSG